MHSDGSVGHTCSPSARLLHGSLHEIFKVPVKIDLLNLKAVSPSLSLSAPPEQVPAELHRRRGLQYHVTVRGPSSGPARLPQLSLRASDQWNTVGDRADHTHTPTKTADWTTRARLDHCHGSHANGGGNFSPLSEI